MAVNVSERKPSFGNRRSHSLRATRHKQKLNLQTVRLYVFPLLKIVWQLPISCMLMLVLNYFPFIFFMVY